MASSQHDTTVECAYSRLESLIRGFHRNKIESEERVEALCNEIKGKDKEIQERDAKLQELVLEIDRLQSAHKNDEKERAAVEEKLTSTEEKLEAISRNFEAIDAVYENMSKNMGIINETNTLLKQRHLQLFALLEHQESKAAETVNQLEDELNTKSQLLMSLDQQFAEQKEDYSKDCKIWKEKMTELQQTCQQLESDIFAKTELSVTMDKNLEHKEHELAQLKETSLNECKIREKEITELRQTCQQLQKELFAKVELSVTMDKNLEHKEHELAQLKETSFNECKIRKEEMEQLQQTCQQLEKELFAKVELSVTMDKNLEHKEHELAQLKETSLNECKIREEKLEELQQTCQQLQKELLAKTELSVTMEKNLKKKLEYKEHELAQLKETSLNECKIREEEIAELQQTCQQQQNELLAKTELSVTLEKILEYKEHELAQLKETSLNECKIREEEIAELQQTCQQLQNELLAKTELSVTMEKNLEYKEHELAQLKETSLNECKIREEEIAELQQTCQQLQNELFAKAELSVTMGKNLEYKEHELAQLKETSFNECKIRKEEMEQLQQTCQQLEKELFAKAGLLVTIGKNLEYKERELAQLNETSFNECQIRKEEMEELQQTCQRLQEELFAKTELSVTRDKNLEHKEHELAQLKETSLNESKIREEEIAELRQTCQQLQKELMVKIDLAMTMDKNFQHSEKRFAKLMEDLLKEKTECELRGKKLADFQGIREKLKINTKTELLASLEQKLESTELKFAQLKEQTNSKGRLEKGKSTQNATKIVQSFSDLQVNSPRGKRLIEPQLNDEHMLEDLPLEKKSKSTAETPPRPSPVALESRRFFFSTRPITPTRNAPGTPKRRPGPVSKRGK